MIDPVDKERAHFEIQTLLESQPALMHVLQNMKQVVWLLDLNTGQIHFASPAFEVVWGRSRESLYADPLLLIKSVHPEDRVNVLSASLDENRTSLSQTYRIARPDGSQRWISADCFLMDHPFAASGYQVCIAQDITDQNQVDEKLRKALYRSREQFTLSRRMSLARKPEAVLKTLISTSILRSAKRAVVLFFEAPQNGPSHGIDIIASWSSAPIPPISTPSEALFEASLFEDLASLDLFHPSKPVIVNEISKDPRLTPVVRDLLLEGQIQTVAIFPLVALGSWLGCLLIFFSKKKQFEPIDLRQLKVLVDQATITLFNLHLLEIEAESRHEAERANEIKTQFLAMISHELRTPLTSIKGFTTTLLAEDVVWEPEEQRDFVLTIQQEANRLEELIEHLLDLSRLEAGMLPIVLDTHLLHEIIDDALPQLLVMTHTHVFSLHLPKNLPPVFVDAKRIAQVMVNLVHNAVLYTPKGTEIVITAGATGGFVQVNVSDLGPGIPQSERKRVFQAFRRGIRAEAGTVNGAGLGLAICKGLIEAHGGRIWIKKQSPPGTTICFTLPKVPGRGTGSAVREA